MTHTPRLSSKLADGRRVTRLEFGAPDGRPVLYCHGFPAAAAEAAFAHAAATAAGVRLIAPDRPGYGGSSPRAFDRVADWADDVPDLLDGLGLARVDVLGLSGGGPYALATAAAVPARVRGVAVIAGLGPLAEIGSTRGMSLLGRSSGHLACRHPSVHALLFRVLAGIIRVWPRAMFHLLAAGAPPCDSRLLHRPELRAIWIEAMRGSVTQGAAPAIAEMRRYMRAWAVDYGRIEQPVALWHGDMDRVVPLAHSRHLAARLPRAHLHELDGEGHFSAPVRWIGRILDALGADAAGSGDNGRDRHR